MSRLRKSIFLAACIFGAGLALAQTNEWKEYLYPADGFAIFSPSEPILQKQIVKATAGEVEVHSYYIPLKDVQLIVLCAALHPNDKRTPEEALNDAKKGPAMADAKLVFEKKISLGNIPGIEMETENAQYHQRGRFYVVDRKVYTLAAAAPKNQPFPAAVQRWYESFRLINREK